MICVMIGACSDLQLFKVKWRVETLDEVSLVCRGLFGALFDPFQLAWELWKRETCPLICLFLFMFPSLTVFHWRLAKRQKREALSWKFLCQVYALLVQMGVYFWCCPGLIKWAPALEYNSVFGFHWNMSLVQNFKLFLIRLFVLPVIGLELMWRLSLF